MRTTDIKMEQRGVAPEHDDAEAERRWCHEMAERLSEHRKRRDSWVRREPWQPKASLDINVRAYEVATTISFRDGFGEKDRTWAKVLPEIIANREGLDPTGRRYLIKRLRAKAENQRERAAKAEQLARRYEALAEQLDDSKHV
jgi:hypothetical protein